MRIELIRLCKKFSSFTLPSSLPASWPSSCGFLVFPFRLIHFCNAIYRHPTFQKCSQWGHHTSSRSLDFRLPPCTAGVWEDSPWTCSGRIVAAQLQVWFGSSSHFRWNTQFAILRNTLLAPRDCWCNTILPANNNPRQTKWSNWTSNFCREQF